MLVPHGRWRVAHGGPAPVNLSARLLHAPASNSSAFSSSNIGRRFCNGAGSNRAPWSHVPTLSSSSTSSSRPDAQAWLHPTSVHPSSSRGSSLRPVTAAASATSDVSAAASHGDGRAARLAAPVVIVGGGPAGLATALMLARRGYTQVKVYERLPEPPAPNDLSVWGNFEQASERLYMIGLNGRGQGVLRGLGVMERIDTASSIVLGRLDWQPDTPPDKPKETIYTNRTYKTRCIQRDRLASCLLQELKEKYSGGVSLEFGAHCVAAEWRQDKEGGAEVCRLTFQRQQQQPASSSSSISSSSTGTSISTSTGTSSIPADTSSSTGATSGISPSPAAAASSPTPSEWVEEAAFVIGADGAASNLRQAMESAASSSSSSSSGFRVKRYEDKNTIVYRTIPMFWPKELAEARPGNLNYSYRHKSGITMDCLPTREGPFIGVMLYKPGNKTIAALKTADDVRALFQEQFPAFLPALREVDLERFAAKQDCSLPTFSYAGPVLHHGSSTCLLGDAIHCVKPYFGQGVNSAFEDVAVLQKALEETADEPAAAVQRYSQLRARDAEALVQLSHSLDGGFLTFVGPLILDSMLSRLLPAVFSPNIIASLQNEKWSFSRIQARKRWDRALQVLLLGGVMAGVLRVVVLLLGWASKLLGRVGAA